jgi:ribosomal protein S18 acetylase RimI-like enzyme
VREASAADTSAVASIGADGFTTSYRTILSDAVISAVVEQVYSREAVEASIRRCTASPGAEFLVAVAEGEVTGFLHFDSEGQEPELHRIYVDPQATGGGVGTALLLGLHARLPAASTYILMVLAQNDRAIRFYERHGPVVERETDAVSHYQQNMAFTPPDTPAVPALIMRYRSLPNRPSPVPS